MTTATTPRTTVTFADRFAAARATYGPLCFGLDPSGALLDDWGVGDTPDGLERFVDVAVEAATGSVAIVKPQSAFYERHGWQGSRALSRLVSECRAAGVLVLLDAKRGDLGSTNEAYAEAYFGEDAGIPVDAMTIVGYLGLVSLRPIFDRAAAANGGVFVVTRSSNPEGRSLQNARHDDDGATIEQRFVQQIAAENARLGLGEGGLGPIGAVFGPGHGAPDFDLAAMNGLFLAPGIGEQGATPTDVATCFATCPERALPSASRSLLKAGPSVAALKQAIAELSAAVRDALPV